MHNVAIAYNNGHGISFKGRVKFPVPQTVRGALPQDDKKAFEWIAAEAGVLKAQIQLGGLYTLGQGVSKNLVEAYAWFSVAKETAERGDKALVKDIEILTAGALGDLPPSERNIAKSKAEEYIQKYVPEFQTVYAE